MMSVALAVALGPAFHVTVDQRPMTRSEAVMRNGVTFVDIDDAVRAFDGVLTYNKRAATITIGYDAVKFTAGKERAKFDGRSVRLRGAPFRENGDLYVPIRFLASKVGHATVRYDRADRLVAIETNAG